MKRILSIFLACLVLCGPASADLLNKDSLHNLRDVDRETVRNAPDGSVLVKHEGQWISTDEVQIDPETGEVAASAYKVTDGGGAYRIPVTDANGNLAWTDLIAVMSLQPYGVMWNESTDTYIRIGKTAGEPVSQSLPDTALPIHANLKRCVINDAGVVQYYLDPSDSTKKADGTNAALNGTDGQVVVDIPAFYHRYTYSAPWHLWEVSQVPLTGFSIHPAFVKNGVHVTHRYIGAYEAYNSGGTLASISGLLPTVSQTRSTFRSQAASRGAGWHQLDFNLASVIQLLYLIEYADFDSQAMIGAGVTTYAAWPNGPQALTGNSNTKGNATGNSSQTSTAKWAASTAYNTTGVEIIPLAAQNGYTYKVTVSGTSASSEPTWPTSIGSTIVDGTVTWICVRTSQYMSYRGIENWYGHLWKFVDGINVHNSAANGSRAYIASNYLYFADNTEVNYDLITSSLAQVDGYAKGICPINDGFLPSLASGGSSTTYLSDYYYTYFNDNPDSGWRVARLGGHANGGASAGAFCWDAVGDSSYSNSIVGGRLCF